MKTRMILLTFFLVLLPLLLIAETADVRIDNPRVDGDYFKFELQIRRTDSWGSGLGVADWYFDYNTSKFGDVAPSYENVNSNFSGYSFSADYSEPLGKLFIQCTPPGTGYEPTLDTWVTVLTVTWYIDSKSGTAGVTWDQSNTGMNDLDPDVITIDNFLGSGDISLPVQMSRFSAETSKEFGVVIHWYTESELNTVGFDIYRSEEDQKSFLKINPALIPGQGNSSSGNEYSFSDRNIQEGIIYWYKIMELAQNGTQQEYGPIKVEGVNTIPDEFSLSHSYPNPFNPVTNFKYQLAEDAKVTINVYNLLGERIKQLVNENKTAGYYTENWEGVNENNQSVSSGIYLIYMQAGSFSMTRKITLIR